MLVLVSQEENTFVLLNREEVIYKAIELTVSLLGEPYLLSICSNKVFKNQKKNTHTTIPNQQ